MLVEDRKGSENHLSKTWHGVVTQKSWVECVSINGQLQSRNGDGLEGKAEGVGGKDLS